MLDGYLSLKENLTLLIVIAVLCSSNEFLVHLKKICVAEQHRYSNLLIMMPQSEVMALNNFNQNSADLHFPLNFATLLLSYHRGIISLLCSLTLAIYTASFWTWGLFPSMHVLSTVRPCSHNLCLQALLPYKYYNIFYSTNNLDLNNIKHYNSFLTISILLFSQARINSLSFFSSHYKLYYRNET